MGKKESQQTSTRASKNEKQLHSLMKVLRPKVYITDSSSFKSLVQELTGYQSKTTPPEPEQVHEKVPSIEIEDQGETPAAATISMDSSFSSFKLCDIDQAFQLEEINQLTDLLQTGDFSRFEVPLMNQQADLLAYQNLESWLLDAEPYSCYYGNSSTQNELEVSLFDYELSGLI
ncbi:VQ - like 5 [Theobroma cacao]|nr:VQ - like 5 [Theobroma cacao]